MPTDVASQTVVVDAPLDRVLATIRAVETQPEWVKEILEAQLLEEFEDGTPATASFRASSPVGSVSRVTLGSSSASDGKSHSCVTAISSSPSPIAKQSSVAWGTRLTIRTTETLWNRSPTQTSQRG